MIVRIIIILGVLAGALTMFLPKPEPTPQPQSVPVEKICVLREDVDVIPNTMVWPFPESTLTSTFGPRDLWGLGFHYGLDFGVDYNTPIPAVVGGTVVFAGWNYGLDVRIQNGQYTYIYAHLNRIDVVVGQTVEMGQIIGLVGSTGFSTGPHLHLEVLDNGTPIDPYPLLKQYGEVKYIPKETVSC